MECAGSVNAVFPIFETVVVVEGVGMGSMLRYVCLRSFFFFQAEDGIRDLTVTGVQTCALPILHGNGHGLSDSMKDMIQHILASPVPVAVYVSPTGARGASAGFYILLSADIAAIDRKSVV